MIPLWMFPVAMVTGNTMVIKPSERDPGATMILMDMLNEAGAPKGVVNVSLLHEPSGAQLWTKASLNFFRFVVF